jgi:hypothetical protein
MSQEWTEILEVGPELAAQWLQDCSFHGQRPISERHLRYLSNEMFQGRFATSQIRMVHVGNRAMITDGQHRLNAVIRTGLPQKFVVYHLIAPDENAAAEDYTHTDIGKKRDQFSMFTATDMVRECGMNSTDFRAYMASLQHIVGSFEYESLAGQNPLLASFATMKHHAALWTPEALQYIETINAAKGSHRRLLMRSSVFSVAMVTIRYQPAMALPFWQSIARDDGLRRGTPAHTLLRFLINTPSGKITSKVYVRRVAAGWTAEYENRNLRLLMVKDPGAPIYIAGTPYDGNSLYIATPI